jgi:hypothetical protein
MRKALNPLVIILALIVPTFAAEKNKNEAKGLIMVPIPVPSAEEDIIKPNAAAQQMLGTYTGSFGANKITVCLQKIIGESVNGYSVVSGNERAFSGAFVEKEGVFEINAKEPGDRPDDGVFVFNCRTGEQKITGHWKPNSRKLEKRDFDLTRREFRYDKTAGFFPEASSRLLVPADVENMDKQSLRMMRNEIYARHGYSFKLKDMRGVFDKVDWYMPISTDVTTQLTEIEQKNQALIKRYENYTAEYYDVFGR